VLPLGVAITGRLDLLERRHEEGIAEATEEQLARHLAHLSADLQRVAAQGRSPLQRCPSVGEARAVLDRIDEGLIGSSHSRTTSSATADGSAGA